MGLETSLLDTTEPQLEWERQDVVRTFCDDNLATNWEGILAGAPQSFLDDLYKYASENLIKLQLFISTPFATEYKRYIETPRISFIANIGGCRPGLMSMNNNLNLLKRPDGSLHGLQFCQPRRDPLLPGPAGLQQVQQA